MGKKYVFLILFTLAIVTGLKPCGASAATLYFTANDNTPPTSLYSIDTVTNTITPLGSLAEMLIPGLSPSPYPNILYAVDRNGGRFLTIDVSTFPAAGSIQVIGNLNRDIRELAYDALTDTLYGFNFANNRLVIIDQTNGNAISTVGNIGLRLRGMTFNQASRTLYGITAETGGYDVELYIIDLSTAAPALLASGEPDRYQISGIHALHTTGTSYDPMYAIGRDSAAFLFSINQATAVETELTGISLPGEIVPRDLAAPFEKQIVPTLSQWSMIIFILLAGLGSIYYLRRKRIGG